MFTSVSEKVKKRTYKHSGLGFLPVLHNPKDTVKMIQFRLLNPNGPDNTDLTAHPL